MSISGNLRTMPFADLLQWVSQSRKTGTLAVTGDPFGKKVYFRDGLVIAASSENPREFLGYYLVGWGLVGEDELQELLDMQDRHGTLLGELLVIIGRLEREQLNEVLRVKTEEAVYDLFLWEEGEFRFLENILPAKKFQPLDMPVDMLIMEGVRRKDELRRMQELLPDPRWVPSLKRAVDVQSLGPTELRILREINGTASLEKVARGAHTSTYFVFEFVYAGVESGLFSIAPPEGDSEASIPGFSAGAWRVLVREAEKLVERGDLIAAQGKLEELVQRHGDKREVQEHVSGLRERIDTALEQLDLDDAAVPELAISVSELTRLSCSPQEGFLLSRVNGRYTLGEIIKVIPGTPTEIRLMVDSLMRREVLRIKPSTGLRRSGG